ncbi:MAG: IS1380 family transposase [Planctomycetota bacterium]
MGEGKQPFFEPSFNRAIKVQAGSDRLTSDGGAMLLREADHRLGLIDSLAERLCDPRQPHLIRYSLGELLRERIYSLALGYRAQDDLDRLAHDPALRMASWNRAGKRVLEERLASQPTQSRLLDLLAHQGRNLEVLRRALGDWVERHLRSRSDHAVRRGTIDVDSFPQEVSGGQQGAAWHGHYQAKIYHPLVASFSVGGDYDNDWQGGRLGNGFIHAILRRGNAHTAEGMLRFLKRVLELASRLAYVFDLRLDAGMTEGRVLDYLTRQNRRFLGRLKGNAVLDALAEPHLKRPPGRPPQEGYETVVELGQYQAASWEFPQRVVLVILDYPDPQSGQLFLEPDYFFLVSGWPEEEMDAVASLAHYRGRGTFEDRLGEFNQALGMQLSSPEFPENEANLLLGLLAFNLANLLRIELEDRLGGCWDLGRFRDYVLKAGGRVAKHSRRLLVHLAQAVVGFWRRLVERISGWRLAPRFPLPRGPMVCMWRPPPRHAHLCEVLRD